MTPVESLIVALASAAIAIFITFIVVDGIWATDCEKLGKHLSHFDKVYICYKDEKS